MHPVLSKRIKRVVSFELIKPWRYLFAGLITLGVAVGIYALSQQVIFGFDQARDAFEAQNIMLGDLKIQGPKTDIDGVFHGVLWYYALVFPYHLFQGDTQLVAAVFFILSLATVFGCYKLTFYLFKNNELAIAASLLYLCSPLFLAFSRWLSNPLIALLITPGLLIALWSYLKRPTTKLASLVGVLMRILIQSDLAFAFFLVYLPIYLIVFKVKPKFSEIGVFLLSLTALCSSYIMVEIKFKGRSILHLIDFFSHAQNYASLTDRGLTIFYKLLDLFSLTFFSIPSIIFAVSLIIMLTLVAYKRLLTKPLVFILLWLSKLMLFLLFSSGIAGSSYVFAPSIIVIVIIFAYLLFQLLPRSAFVPVVCIVVLLQWQITLTWLKNDTTPLSVQRGISITTEQKVVEATYAESGSAFTINTVTNPLGINTTWAYLYDQYGKKDTDTYLIGKVQTRQVIWGRIFSKSLQKNTIHQFTF